MKFVSSLAFVLCAAMGALAAEGWSDLASARGVPHRIEARVEVESDGILASGEGTYVLEWLGPDRWAERLVVGGRSYARGVSASRRWRIRPEGRLSPRAVQIVSILGPGSHVSSAKSSEPAPKPRNKKISGRAASCVRTPGSMGTTERCLDSQSGALLRDEMARLGLPRVRREYAAHETFGGSLLPREIRLVEGSKEVLRLTIVEATELSANAEVPGLPDGAETFAWCAEPKPPFAVEKPVALFSPELRRQGREGGAVALVLIGTDGAAAEIDVIAATNDTFARSSVDALRRWRWLPASCGDTPVPFESTITMTFGRF